MNSESVELLPCPFCGLRPQKYDTGYVLNHGNDCIFRSAYNNGSMWLSGRVLDLWQTRATSPQRDELREALQRLLRAFEADVELLPECDIETCWETNGQAIEQARKALSL